MSELMERESSLMSETSSQQNAGNVSKEQGGKVVESDDVMIVQVESQTRDAEKETVGSGLGKVVEKYRCDCLISRCPGCHFPCKECGSRMCGQECKIGRDWEYEQIIVQGPASINGSTRERKY